MWVSHGYLDGSNPKLANFRSSWIHGDHGLQRVQELISIREDMVCCPRRSCIPTSRYTFQNKKERWDAEAIRT